MEPPFPSPFSVWHNAPYAAISPNQPHLSLKGKTVVVTGGGRGIGRAVVQAFAAAGASIIGITGRTQSSLDGIKSEIASSFPETKLLTFAADVQDEKAMSSAFSAIKDASPSKQGVDILVHNAGYFADFSLIGGPDADTSEWFKSFEINLRGSYNTTRAFLANMHAKSESNPVEPLLFAMSTLAICFSPIPPMFSSYVTSMVAKAQFFQSVASENPDVRVVNVHPGAVDTDMGKKAHDNGVVLPQDDVNLSAHFLVWLASKEAEWIRSKMVWCNWDVEELKSKKDQIMADPGYLNIGLKGWPFEKA